MSCANSVRDTLMNQPGVKEVVVDFPSKTAFVAPADKFDLDGAKAAFAKKGRFSISAQ